MAQSAPWRVLGLCSFGNLLAGDLSWLMGGGRWESPHLQGRIGPRHRHRLADRVEAAAAGADNGGADEGDGSAYQVNSARTGPVDHPAEEGVGVMDGEPGVAGGRDAA